MLKINTLNPITHQNKQLISIHNLIWFDNRKNRQKDCKTSKTESSRVLILKA